MITAAIRRRRAAMGAALSVFLFAHGSSMASQPTFDLTVPGRPDSSVSHLTTRNAAR